MQKIVANNVEIDDSSVDYGYGSVCFCWADPLFVYDRLSIDLEGFCSRRMPRYSGTTAQPIFLILDRNRAVIRFFPDLAKQLLLDEAGVEISFNISDNDFARLAAF
jgi:hypothetical protein